MEVFQIFREDSYREPSPPSLNLSQSSSSLSSFIPKAEDLPVLLNSCEDPVQGVKQTSLVAALHFQTANELSKPSIPSHLPTLRAAILLEETQNKIKTGC